jgi:hypothetical protein
MLGAKQIYVAKPRCAAHHGLVFDPKSEGLHRGRALRVVDDIERFDIALGAQQLKRLQLGRIS